MLRIADLEALDLISRLPDDTPLTVSEAAIFIRVSKSSLDKMRRPDAVNPGPVYSQGGAEGASGTNQKVVYFKSDLKAWLLGNRSTNTLDAARRRGQMFATSLDMVEPEAFWRNEKGEIAGLVLETSANLFFERLGSWGIEWLALPEALNEPWEDEALLMQYVWLYSSQNPEEGSSLTARLMLRANR